jgi:hypothetical protein
LVTIFNFNGTASEGSFPSNLTLATDGNFYGISAAEDVNNGIFRFVPGTDQLTVLFTFPEFERAVGQLAQAANGDLFGEFKDDVTGVSAFFSINPDGTGFQTLGGISASDEPNFPLLLASDGNLWSTNFSSKTFPDGSVFNVSDDGAILQRFAFDGTNGQEPEVGVIQGADGNFYGTTIAGGTITTGGQSFADGTVWSLDAGLPLPAPAIALLNPTSGSVGSTVLINGNNFIGATSVSFNGVGASFSVLNLHFISVTVPTGATSGQVTVTTAGGSATSAGTFIVE